MQTAENGLTLKISYDENAESPREYRDNAGTMLCWHRRYNLGDKHDFEHPQDFVDSEAKNAFVMLPLYLYDHSGLAISTHSFIGRAVHAEWDSGQVGFIYISADKVKDKTGVEPIEENKERVKSILESEVEEYDQYLNGEAYSFEITDENGEFVAGGNNYYANSMGNAVREMKESCWEYDFLFAKLQKQLEKEYAAE